MKKIAMYVAGFAFVLASCSKNSDDSTTPTPAPVAVEIPGTGVKTFIPIVAPTDPTLPKGSTSTNDDGSKTTTVNTYNADGTIKATITINIAKDGTKTKVIKEHKYDGKKNTTEIHTYYAGLDDDKLVASIEKETYANFDAKGQYSEKIVTKYDTKGQVSSVDKSTFTFDSNGVLTNIKKEITYQGETNTYDLVVYNANLSNGNFVSADMGFTFGIRTLYNDNKDIQTLTIETQNNLYGSGQYQYTYTTYPVSGKTLVSDENPAGKAKYKVETANLRLGGGQTIIKYTYSNDGKLTTEEKDIRDYSDPSKTTKITIKYNY